MKKSKKIIAIIVIILLLAIIGVGTYFIIRNIKDSNNKIEELENKISKINEINNTQNNIVETNKNDVENTQNSISTSNTIAKNTAISNTSTEKNSSESMLNVNGKYAQESNTEEDYYRSNIVVSDQTDSSIHFSINAAHGRDVDHVNIGDLEGTAKKVSTPSDYKISESDQLSYEYSETIDGKTYKIIFIFTAHKKFQYVNVKEEYPNDFNPFAGSGVNFAGEYEIEQ